MLTSITDPSTSGKTTMRWRAAALAIALAAVSMVALDRASWRAAGSGLPQGDDPVHLKPGDFSANIDNHQWPMTVGSRWVYRVVDSSDGSVQHEVIRVTARTKLIADGIQARVVRDIATEHGRHCRRVRHRSPDAWRRSVAMVSDSLVVRRSPARSFIVSLGSRPTEGQRGRCRLLGRPGAAWSDRVVTELMARLSLRRLRKRPQRHDPTRFPSPQWAFWRCSYRSNVGVQ